MSSAQARRRDGLADGDAGRGDQVSEDRPGSGMDPGRAMGREGSIAGVDLGDPEHLPVARGPVNGVQERPGLRACLLEQGFQGGKVRSGLASAITSRCTQIRSLCAPAAAWPVHRLATPSRRWDADGAGSLVILVRAVKRACGK